MKGHFYEKTYSRSAKHSHRQRASTRRVIIISGFVQKLSHKRAKIYFVFDTFFDTFTQLANARKHCRQKYVSKTVVFTTAHQPHFSDFSFALSSVVSLLWSI
jgi:hypothetical protein